LEKKEMNEIKSLLKDLKFGFIKYFPSPPEAILGETTIGQLLAVPSKDSEAGSNPREFQGMKSRTNKKILESFLKNHNRAFWALHSGVSMTITNGRSEDENSSLVLLFDDACLTNGLQTVTIGRILTLIKAYQLYTEHGSIHTKINRNMSDKWQECINASFPADISKQLLSINLEHVNSILSWLHQDKNAKYLQLVNSLSLPDIINTKLSFKAVLLDELADLLRDEDSTEESDLTKLGTKIAEANNETQRVDPGDIFGTGNKQWLNTHLFSALPKNIKIEYRRFEEDRADVNQRVIHVLDLLRAILPTTFIVERKPKTTKIEDVASFVAGYANMREPIYNLFNRIIQTHQTKKHPEIERVVVILRNLMPAMAKTMAIAEVFWNEQRKKLNFERVNEWSPLRKTTLGKQLFEDEDSTLIKKNADTEIRKFLSFSFANLFPIFVFATRSAIEVSEDFSVQYEIEESTISHLVEEIYQHLVIVRLQSTLGSTSNLFRDSSIYRTATLKFNLICRVQKKEYVDYTTKYRVELT
jgi:hypothetical protein